jgi:phosphate starvation-inducible PhoH-like protein
MSRSTANTRRNKRERNMYEEEVTSHVERRVSPSSSKLARSGVGFKQVQPKNFAQGMYLESIRNNQITFGTGSAGTGKTFIAASYAAEQLFYKNVNKIILTRPAVTAEEDLGFLPGDLSEKYEPYLLPFKEIFEKTLGKSFYECCLKDGVIEPAPIGYLRGRTFDNAIILIDEAQNVTCGQMKLILSRIGENCKIIISGDTGQKDIDGPSGLTDAINRLSHIPGVDVVNFLPEDIVRSKLCKQIIMSYEN